MAKEIDIGAYSAYAIAVEHGYEGTEAEFAAQLMNSAANGALAQDGAKRAEAAAEEAAEILDSIPEDYTTLSERAVENTEKIGQLSEEIRKIGNHCYYQILENDFAGNYIYNVNGVLQEHESFATSKPVLLKAGEYLEVTARSGNEYQCIIFQCREDGSFVSSMRTGGANVLVTKTVGGLDRDVYFAYSGNMKDTIRAVVYTPIAKLTDVKALEEEVDAIVPGQKKIYYVGADKEYTSFTACLQALHGDETPKEIHVDAGTYNVFEEIGGADFCATIQSGQSWKDVSVIVPPNTDIIGIGNVILEFLPTAEEIGEVASNLLSPLNLSYSGNVENITIRSHNCRYGIHDDGAENGAIVKRRYRNVKVYHHYAQLGFYQAFGGGFKQNFDFMFDNCLFASTLPLSFHNNGTYNVDNTSIIFNNCVFVSDHPSWNPAIRLGNVNGVQTHVRVELYGCYLDGKIKVNDESSIARPNAFDIMVVGSSATEVDVDSETNIYTPTVYSF